MSKQSVLLDEATKAALMRVASEQQRSVSDVVRLALQSYIEAHAATRSRR